MPLNRISWPINQAIVINLAGDESICSLARRLLAGGADPAAHLDAFAKLTVQDGPNGAPRFRLHRPANVGGQAQDRAKRAGAAS